MSNSLNLHGANVLVTGASGFIGGRLVDYLVHHYGANVRALVRNFGRAVHLARLPVKLIPGDILEADILHEAAAGCDVIFHCAAGMSGEDDLRRRITVDGTRNVLEAALAAGVKRFIHVSTMAVYGPNPGAWVDEDTPLVYSDDVYSDSKIDAEKLAFQYASQHGLRVVVFRPTIVYGPRSGSWTLGPLNNMQKGAFTLIEAGSGLANPVYVDDVVQALLLGAVNPQAIGEAFIVSHGEAVTWKEFFNYYACMLGIELPNLTLETIRKQRKVMQQLRSPLGMGMSFVASPRVHSAARQIPGVRNLVNLAENAFPRAGKQAILERATALREVKLHPPAFPRQGLIDFFCAKSVFKIDKAQRILGYQPQFDLETGMQLTETWLRHTRLI